MDMKELRKARLARLAKKSEAQMMYNPLVQKPKHLEPVGPRGGYHYFGPMPDQGTSYGLYEDEKGNKVICMAGERAYSPFSGTEMKKVEDVPADQVKNLVPAEAGLEYSCVACRTPFFTSGKKECAAQEKLHCTQCGSEMADVLAKIKSDVEAQFDPEAPKPEHMVDVAPELLPVAPAPVVVDVKDSSEEKVEEPKADEPKVEEPKVEEAKKESTKEESVKEESPAAAQIEESKKESSKEMPVESPTKAEESKESSTEVLPLAEAAESKESVKESSTEALPLAEAKEESKKESTKESAFEPISEMPEEVKAEDIRMTLYAETSANPFWNVEIKGQPIARITLADQEQPDEDRIVFCSKEYPETLARAMEKVGAKIILDTMKAKFFANKVDESELASKIRAEITTTLETEHKEKLANLRNELMDCLNIATSAINKNWYAEEGHALKEALYARMEKAGMYDPIDVIEGAFEEASGDFFDHLFTKAIDIMNKHPEARAELRDTLMKTNALPIVAGVKTSKKVSLAEKLESSSFALQAGASGAQPKNTIKEVMRSKIKLGHRR